MPPIRYGWKDDHVSLTLVIEVGVPESYREAIEADDYGKWTTAMVQEMDPLDRN